MVATDSQREVKARPAQSEKWLSLLMIPGGTTRALAYIWLSPNLSPHFACAQYRVGRWHVSVPPDPIPTLFCNAS